MFIKFNRKLQVRESIILVQFNIMVSPRTLDFLKHNFYRLSQTCICFTDFKSRKVKICKGCYLSVYTFLTLVLILHLSNIKGNIIKK